MNDIELKFEKIIENFEALVVFKNILDDPIVYNLVKVMKKYVTNEGGNSDFILQVSKLESLLISKAEQEGYGGNILNEHILNLVFMDENIYSLLSEKYQVEINTSLKTAVLSDISSIVALMYLNPLNYIQSKLGKTFLSINYIPLNYTETKYSHLLKSIYNIKKEAALLNSSSEINEYKAAEILLSELSLYCRKYGCGYMSIYNVFKYNPQIGLVGVKDFDKISFKQLIKYEYQKETIINNTKAFINGLPANNVLLTGVRGTGKSSCVKALANEFFNEGLRLVEISKNHLNNLSDLFAILKNRGKKFIIFIDDLSFDTVESQYKELKSLLEGGVEKKPDNVLIYVTSNRRHLVQENWSDRNTGNEEAEIHSADVMNEKISLSDRFALIVSFPKPSVNEYFEIVKGIAKNENITIPVDEITKLALSWELNKNISGRTAKQFVDNYKTHYSQTVSMSPIAPL